MRKASFVIVTAALVLLCAVPASASTSAPPTDRRADPAEPINRVGYAIHQVFDRYLIRPAAMTYQAVWPKPLRTGISNVLNNLDEPVVLTNDLLQGRFRKAGASSVRFLTNSTIGVAGLFDVATRVGIPRHDNGFDLTLGRAGFKPGPYLYIPLIGPTTVRDGIGRGVNVLMDPFHYIAVHDGQTVIVGRTVVTGLDQRASADADLKALMSDATDPYATLRSVYLQNQQSKIDDNSATSVPQLPDFDDDKTTPAPLPATTAKPAG